jgi:methionine biosynthesis protein MetW
MFKHYYNAYWKKRTSEKKLLPIRKYIPSFLKKYTTYGAILNSLPRGGRFLDVGCGDGNVSQLFLERGDVYGIDISSKALKQAQKKGIKVQECDLNQGKLPFTGSYFDAVILTDVIEHLIDIMIILREARRVLKKNGRLIITVPNFARIGNRLRMIAGDPRDMLQWQGYGDEIEHLHWFTKPKLEYLLKKNSFEKVKFIPTGLPYGFIFGILSFPGLAKILTVIAGK